MDKSKREQVARACQRCASSKRKCSGTFPCDRCVRLGAESTCMQVRTKREVDVVEPVPRPSGGPSRGRGHDNGYPGHYSHSDRIDHGDYEMRAPTILGAAVFDSYADTSGGSGRKRRAQRLSRDVVSAHEDYTDDGAVAGGPMGGFRDFYGYRGGQGAGGMGYEGYGQGAGGVHPGGRGLMRPATALNAHNPHGRVSIESGGDASWDGTENEDGRGGRGGQGGFEGDLSEAESEMSHTGMSSLLARTHITPHLTSNMTAAQQAAFAHQTSGMRSSKMRRVERSNGETGAQAAGSDFTAMTAVDLLLRASGEAVDGAPAYAADLRQAAQGGEHGQGAGSRGQKHRSRAVKEPPFEVQHQLSYDPANSTVADANDLDLFGAVPVWRLTFADATTGTPMAPPEGSVARVGAKPLGEGMPFRLEANMLGCIMFNAAEDMLLDLPMRDNVWLHPMDLKERQLVASKVREMKATYYNIKGRYLRTIVHLVEEEDPDLPLSERPNRGSFSAFHVLSGTNQRRLTGSFSLEPQPPVAPASVVTRKRYRKETSYEVFTAQEHVYLSYWASGCVKSLLSAFEGIQIHSHLTKEEYEVLKMSATNPPPAPASPQSPQSVLAPGILAAIRSLPPPEQMQAALAALHVGDEVTYKAITHLINNPQLPRTTAYSRGESFSDNPGGITPAKSYTDLAGSAAETNGMRRGSSASYGNSFAYSYVDTEMQPNGGGAPGVQNWQTNWASNMAAAQAVAAAGGVALPLVGPAAAVSMIRSPSEQMLARGSDQPSASHPLATPQAPSVGSALGYHNSQAYGHGGSFSGRYSGDFSGSGVFDSIVQVPVGSTDAPFAPPVADSKLTEPRTISNTSMGLGFNDYNPMSLSTLLPGLPSHESERTESSSSMGLRFVGPSATSFGLSPLPLPGSKDTTPGFDVA